MKIIPVLGLFALLSSSALANECKSLEPHQFDLHMADTVVFHQNFANFVNYFFTEEVVVNADRVWATYSVQISYESEEMKILPVVEVFVISKDNCLLSSGTMHRNEWDYARWVSGLREVEEEPSEQEEPQEEEEEYEYEDENWNGIR